MALGAERHRVVEMVVREGMVMALVGVLVGTLGGLVLMGLMESLLFGVAPRDPLTFLVVPPLFAAVALAACWVPAARGARIEPSTALRYD